MSRHAARALAAHLFLAGAGCASGPSFRDQPVVWQADDRRDIPEPEEREYRRHSYFARVFFARAWTRALELRDSDPALNVNALDEVPNSTWFQNRIGVRPISPDEAARGPVTTGPPQPPITIKRGKDPRRGNPGFFGEDATGRTFLVKFDTKDNPEMQTAASVVVNRALWTAGYNVPEDTIFHFARKDLHLAPDAKVKDSTGHKIPMTTADVETMLATSPRTVDGRYRASASLFLSGVPKGGIRLEGRRYDDPNDRVDHEDRRELRGLRVLAAWLGHTDMKEDNTLDMYVEEDGRHFLRHYLLDFGEALGSHQAEKDRLEDGYEHVWDYEENGKALLAFGLWKREWEYQTQTPWPAIGAFSDEHFDPEDWKEAYPYWPFHETDAADLYWGAKLVMRFDRALIEAIVAEGQLTNPSAATYLVHALLGRRNKIGHAWLEALTPFDYLHIEPGKLCGADLGVRYGLVEDGALVRVDEHGDEIDRHRVARDGNVCVPLEDDDDYRVLHLRAARGSRMKPAMQVHYKGGANARILGIIRQP